MTTMSADQFLQIVIDPAKIRIENIEVQGDVLISSSIVNSTKHEFSIVNCKIPKLNVTFSSFNQFRIENSDIEILEIGHVQIERLDISNNKRIGILTFNSSATKLRNVYIQSNQIIGKIKVEPGSRMTDINIIDNATIQEFCAIIDASIALFIKGESSTLAHIENIKISSPSNVSIAGISTGILDISGVRNRVYLEEIKANTVVTQSGNLIELNRCDAQWIDMALDTNISIKGGSYGRISGRNGVGQIEINKSISADICQIENLDLPDMDFKGHLSIASCKITNVNLQNAKIIGSAIFSFRLSRIEKFLNIENAGFGKIVLESVDLAGAKVYFLNSSWKSSEIQNVQWPSKFEEKPCDGVELRGIPRMNMLWSLKAGYQMFKMLSIKENNKIDAIAFQKHELSIYWKIVHQNYIERPSFKGTGTWLILGTNRLFSDFGQSISRPLVWLMLLHSMLFFCLLCNYDLGISAWPTARYEIEATRAGIAMFFNLISPVHSTEIQNEVMDGKTSIYGTIDFFMRILSGYFIYYFLLATRRFNFSV